MRTDVSDATTFPACINHPDVNEGVQRCSRCERTFCANCLVVIAGAPVCAACKNERVLDLRSGFDATTLSIASRGRRFVGNLIDVLPLVIVFMVIVIRAVIAGRVLQRFDPVVLLIGFSFVIYDGLMTQFRSQTLGKMAMRTKVVRIDGTQITAAQAWGRALSRYALNYLYVVDWITIFFTREKLCVHDMLAKTRVVNTD
jgi:uncharacterized RDD family membrane protein YckC